MSTAIGFAGQLGALREMMRQNHSWPSPDMGFAAYLSHTAGVMLPFVATPVPLEASPSLLANAPYLAAAGYGLALNLFPNDAASIGVLIDAFNRLSSRNAFPNDRQSFAFRPVELLGIAVGASACGARQQIDSAWLRSVLAKLETKSLDAWSTILTACAAALLETKSRMRIQVIDTFGAEELGLLKWIKVVHPELAENFPAMAQGNAVEQLLLHRCTKEPIEPRDLARASALHFGLDRSVSEFIDSRIAEAWQLNRESRDTMAVVTNLCERFPLLARQLLVRHNGRAGLEIKDEYDVQDVMHAILKLHFEDVRAEEWTPSYAGNAARTDFLLKPERVFVEVKMTRKNLGQKEVASQLTEDKDRYRQHPDCKALVCFVYDPGHKCHNPTALEQDVVALAGGFPMKVVVAPK